MRASAEDAGRWDKEGGEDVIRLWTRLMERCFEVTESIAYAWLVTVAAIAGPFLWIVSILYTLRIACDLIEFYSPLGDVILQYLQDTLAGL